jgi:asparagine synthase (glutamine-hydrolysing)
MRAKKLRAVLAAHGTRLEKYLICRQLMFPQRRRTVLGNDLQPELVALPVEIASALEQAILGLDAVNAQSLLELSLYLANMLLRDADQMSMAHSLEIREPLLDHVLVETVARLPGAMKLAPGQRGPSKGLLVDALPGELPRPTLRRPKMGFVLPWERWLRHELKSRVAHTLTDPSALGNAGLDPAGVQTLWNGFLAGQPGIRYSDILALLHLLAWVKRHRLSVDSMESVVRSP